MSTKKTSTPDTSDREIVISRILHAPRALVWQAWTDPAHLAQWWGPKEFTNPVCKWNAQPGQAIHVVMRAPNGTEYPMGGGFREVVAAERLVFTSGALDEKGELLFEILHRVTFVERNGKTTLKIVSRIIKTTPGARKYTDGFEAGMTQSLERLEKFLTGTADREIVISRVVDAPRALVWQAWTDPKHVVKWWGPRGFSDTTQQHDFRVGGVWEHIMTGPDGVNYPNKATFKEIIPQASITFTLGGGRVDKPGVSFTATWTFETVEGGKTKLTGRMVFPTAAARDFVAKEFGAVEGGKQTLERLGEYLPKMTAAPGEFVISRILTAPRELVWQCWTDAKHMTWWGPKGATISQARMDFRPGGIFHYGMRTADSHAIWGKWVIREITPPERLVFVNSFSDEAGGLTRHPRTATWPLELLSTITFAEQGDQTLLTIRWLPLNATPVERKTFDESHDSMNQGWGGSLEQLTAYLAEIQKDRT